MSSQNDISRASDYAQQAVDVRMPELSSWCETLFDFGEPAWREYRSAAWYVQQLRAEGFDVEEGSANMPTALNALGGIPTTIDPMINNAAKVLSALALRILLDESARDVMMQEFVDRTGGGVGGRLWQAPLCDYEPPVNFRWPEYINTLRGRDWHIPAAMPGA